MTPRIVILGAGTGGTLVANRLQRALSGDAHEQAAGGQIVVT